VPYDVIMVLQLDRVARRERDQRRRGGEERAAVYRARARSAATAGVMPSCHPACDGEHEMSDLGAVCEPVHRAAATAELACSRGDLDRPFRRLMEITMNAVNDTCELTEADLDVVAGGQPTHHEFGASYGPTDLYFDIYLAFHYALKGK
jgi:hypothetical protein